jgi:hypothetical protein
MALPPFSGTDEGAHAIRSAAAARGHWTGPAVLLLGWHMTYKVPEGLGNLDRVGCFDLRAAHGAPACHPSFSPSNRLVDATSYEFRGFPAYYTIVGLPSLLPRGADSYRMRVLSAIICAAFAASAVVTALRRRDRAASVLAVMLVMTPEVLYLASLVNPSGLEIICSIVLFSALLALAGATTETDKTLVRRAGVALVVLIAVRSLDPGVALLALGSFLVIAPFTRVKELLRRTDVRGWLAAAAAVVVAQIVWILTVGISHQEHRQTYALGQAFGRWDDLLRESVGVFGLNDVRIPVAVYVVWAVVAVVAFGTALVLGTTRHRVTALALLACAWLLGVSVDALNFPNIGFAWQGRYGLPILVAAVLVALDGIRTPERSARFQRAFARLSIAAVVALLLGQVAAFMSTASRYGTGGPFGWNPFAYLSGAAWEPRLPALLLLAAFAAGTIGLGIVVCTRMRPGRPASVPA